jgi:hypothetical protein
LAMVYGRGSERGQKNSAGLGAAEDETQMGTETQSETEN